MNRFSLSQRIVAAMAVLASTGMGRASDSVDVTFYYKSANQPAVVYLAGEFNHWANNQGGRITDPAAAMTYNPGTGLWSKTARLRVGGPETLPDPGRSVPSAYQYKFNENGSVDGWKPDPLNPAQNPNDMNNSLVFPRNPTILYLLPNSLSGLVVTPAPEITAYLFPSTSSVVNTQGIEATVDGIPVGNLGVVYDIVSKQLRFFVPDSLRNGDHQVVLRVRNQDGSVVSDSAEFRVQAGTVRMLTIGDPRYLHAQKTVDGNVEDPGIFEVAVYRNLDSVLVPVSAGRFSVRLSLVEGENRIWAAGTNPSGQRQTTDTISIEYWVDHAPKPVISQSPDRQNIVLTVTGNDPDGDAVRIAWGPAKSGSVSMDPVARDSTATFYGPMAPGEYKVTATATDPSGLTGWAAALFTVLPDNSVRAMDMRSNPGWVRDAVVYEIFLPSFTTEGTLRAAQERLEHVRSLGTTVVWLMPVYPNGEAINELNAGYNVTDFYDIHPQLGTLEDFWAFVDEAHRLGLRVILDTTPNHVSENHPWVKETALYGEYANARPIIEKRVLGDNRGMGQSPVVNQGDTVYVHYDGWRLANLNYESPETRFEMLGMYRWWVEDCGADGFRMDVYWGPRNRYGTPAWWRPFRSEIKRTNPDVFILGETDGTGPGTEADYADSGGACDAAYDWNFFNRVRETLRGGAVDELDLRVRNFTPDLEYNHFTGPNAHYFRFLENHDETRIAGSFTQAQARAGSALLLLAPGIPMLYAGQEAGETSRRGRVMWDRAGAAEMENWYTNLLAIRNGFDCFRSASIQRIQAEPQRVYAFLRPDTGLCSAAAVNFSDRAVTARLAIDPALIRVHGGGLEDGKTYYASDVLNDTVYSVTAAGLGSFRVKLAAYGAAALVVSDVPVSRPDVKPPPGPADGSGCILFQNHPNPFRERTEIVYWISNESMDTVSLAVYDVLGNMVRVIVEEKKPSGEYTAQWDGKDGRGGLAASGVYVCRLTVGGKGCAKKMAMVR